MERDTTHAAAPRGIEHIGITVPDHALAVRFFEQAFDATVLFSLVRPGETPLDADQVGMKNGLRPGTAIVAVSMLRLANGPNLEIFEIDRPRRIEAATISDVSVSHFSVNVDDIDAATMRFAEAGGTLLEGPYQLTGQEQGAGNLGRFGLTPWGLLIEFQHFGSPIRYDAPELARWIPEPASKT